MRAAALSLLCLAACETDGRPRYVAAEDGFSIIELAGWTARRELNRVARVVDHRNRDT